MERSLQCELTLPRPNRWVRELPAATATDGPKTAFRLLLVFLLILYSSVAILFPALNALRPALIVALAAIGMMVLELGQTGRSFRLLWPQGALLFTFLAVAFVSSFDAMWAKLAFERTSDIAKIVLIYVVIENTVISKDRLHTVLLTMVIGGLFPALGTINNYLHGILREGRAAWVGVFANANENAYALVILVPIAWAIASKSGWLMRIALWAVIGVYVLAIYVTYSRGGLLGLFAVLGLIGWKQKSIVLRGLMVAALIGAVFVMGMYWKRDQGFNDISNDTTYNQRIATIKAGVRMFYAHPLLGVGPGCSIVAYPLFVPPEAHCGCQLQLVIHNTVIQALSETGLLGFVPFMLFLGLSIFHAWRMQKGPLSTYAAGLEIAMWGFLVCGLSGGFSYSWFPYILIGLIVAAKHIAAPHAAESSNAVI